MGFASFTEFYRQILWNMLWITGRKQSVAALIIFTGSLTLIPFMGAEFIPQADEGKNRYCYRDAKGYCPGGNRPGSQKGKKSI